MSGHNDAERDDDFHAEVSDLRPRPESGSSSMPPARSPLDPRLTSRQRFTRLAVLLVAGLLMLAVIWSANPNLRDQGVGLIPGQNATATPTLSPDGDQFYLLPNPPGVDVSLDGHILSRLPLPGDHKPLRLAVGHHTFAWRSHTLPFQPLQCAISVPHALSDTCPLVSGTAVPQTLDNLHGFIIGMHVSLAALAPDDAAPLSSAMRQALDAATSTSVVQPGEHYYSNPSGQNGAVVVARQPLRATLSYQLVTDAGYSEPCILGQPLIPCRFPGQNCAYLCTVTPTTPASGSTANEWIAAALVHAQWTYATLDGHIVVANSAESFGLQLVVLRITWDGAAWHVVPVLGHTAGLDVADDLVCDPARIWFARSTWAFMLVDPPPGEQALFASDATPADGCVVVLEHGVPALFLERFGVLLTINEYARNPIDNFPIADATEQQLAHQLTAPLHV